VTRAWITLALCLLLGNFGYADVVLRGASSGWAGGLAESGLQRLQARLSQGDLRLALAPVGSDLDQLRALSSGELQIALVRSSALANYYRPWSLLTLPYLFGEGGAAAWLQGIEGQRLLLPGEGQPWRCLLYLSMGPRCIASPQPISNWQGLRSKTVLVPQSRFSWEFYKSLGCDPWAGALEGAQDKGRTQATEATLLDLHQGGWLQGQSYVWQPGHAEEWLVLLIDERVWSKLSGAHRQRLTRSLSEVELEMVPQIVIRQSEARALLGLRFRQDPPEVVQGQRPRFSELRKRLLRLLDGRWMDALP